MQSLFNTHYKYARLCERLYKTPNQVKCVKLHPSKGLVMIQGSATLCDWKLNAKVELKKEHDVHWGIYEYAASVIENNNIRELYKECEHITFIGHSSGGAAALIVVYLMNENLKKTKRKPLIELVLFGIPKISGNSFTKMFQKIENVNMYIYKNGNDIVCRFPIGLEYNSFHPMLNINASDSCIPSVHDHFIASYRESLFSLAFPEVDDKDASVET